MDGKNVFHNDIPGGIIRTPSPYEFLPSYKLSEGNVYKSPIFIKNQEANAVPVVNDVNYSSSTNGQLCHEDDFIFTTKSEPNQTPTLKHQFQDVTNIVKCEEPTEEKPVINGANKLHNPNDESCKSKTVETNSNKFQRQLLQSPRKSRTRSVESAICNIEQKLQRKGVKRTRSVEVGLQCPSKFPKLDLKELKIEKQVPNTKYEHKVKERRSRDKNEHRSEHKSSRDKKRRCSIGIQARPSQDSGRHYLKLLEPRPCLLESGNLSYPPSDVSCFLLNLVTKIFSSSVQKCYVIYLFCIREE